MFALSDARQLHATLAFLTLVWMVPFGCSRTQYRLRADHDAYNLIAERNFDPRWAVENPSIEIDPRSRYFDPYDPDCPPMPADDPLAHQYMRLVDGKKGWRHWYDNGHRNELENPSWQQSLSQYVEMSQGGAVKLNLDSALRLAYVHSPNHQSQLETLYLSALDVTAERFRLDTQFFGGYDTTFEHLGSLVPASLNFDPASGRYVISPPFHTAESNRLTVGRPSSGNAATTAQRQFATAGQLLAGFANSFVFEFTGGDANFSASLANFTFIQPLLRGAGRDIALEQLTSAERTLLANLRAYGQFRQGFYTQVAIGELGVIGPERFGVGTSLPVFGGRGSLGGYAGLLQQLQEIRNSQDNLNLQLRTLKQLEAFLEAGQIDLVQVDQFRQNVESERAALLQRQNDFEFALDRYKTGTLGLPPNLPVNLDDSLIQQFQLVTRESTEIEDEIETLQDQIGAIPDDASADQLGLLLDVAARLIDQIRRHFENVEVDLNRMDEIAPQREASMAQDEQDLFRQERAQLWATLEDVRQKLEISLTDLLALQAGLTEQSVQLTARGMVSWSKNLLRQVQRSVPVQGRARLEAVTIDAIQLVPEQAFETALANRFDFMNGRAALVDSWRQVQVRADALQSVLNVTADGDIRTARNNAASFRAPTSNLRMGVEFDAPLTRLLERNDYRESLIDYQRSRRGLIQSRDALHLGLRSLLRQIQQLRTNLEIQRRAVAIAFRQVDLTREELYRPVPIPPPGQRVTQFGPTSAFNLLASLRSMRDTQNSFLRAWLEYYAARMRLTRELGTMVLDHDGRWMDSADLAYPQEQLPPDEPNQEELPSPGLGAANDHTANFEFDVVRLPPDSTDDARP